MLLLLLLCLTHCFEPVLIERFGRSKNKLEAAPPPEFECVDEIDEDDTPPKEYSLKIGSLYHLADGSWYLRSEDPTTKQTSLINLNDVTRVKYIEKELEAEKPEEQPEQVLKEFEWTPLIAFERFPRNRGGHSMHAIGDFIVLFGGCFLDIQCFGDLFLFNARTRVWTSPRVFGIPPVGRNGFGAMVNGAKLYIFGGHTLQGLMNDLFVFDLESRSWNQLFWPGQVPTPRAGHKMVLTQLGGLIFGGFVGETYTNEIYILDIVNERWGKPTAGGDVPVGRESFSMTYHHGVTYVFGGYATGNIMNDVYTIGEDLTWEKKEAAGKIPSPRQGAAIAEYDNRIFIAGGCNPKEFQCYNDIYALDISTIHFSTVNAFQKKNLKDVEYGAMVFAGPLLVHFGGCKLMKTCSDSLTGILMGSIDSCPQCRNGGECRVGHCSCQPGWQGPDCTQKVLCKQNCLNQGTCMSNGYCRCYPGYTGSVCQLQIPCPGNCTDFDHGVCQLDGKCKCNDGFTGDTCGGDEEITSKLPANDGCLDECNHHGECNYQTGLCACDYGFSGPDCSLVQGSESEYKSIWDLLKDDEPEPELGTTNVNMKDFVATGYKFNQREEGPVPVYANDFERVYYEDVDENGNVIDEQEQPLGDSQIQTNEHKHHKHKKEQASLQPAVDLIPNLKLTMVPPKKKEEEDPFTLLLLDECPKRCSEHGVCIENQCYCWLGYTGDWCQASKIGDFYLGWKKSKVIEACIICFLFGMLAGYCIVLLLRKRGNDDEFRNMSEVPSQKIEDNEGEVEELLV